MRGLEIINQPGRNVPVDLFRALAVLAVMLFHFGNLLPFGFLGVDLFFVISGLLIGGLLIKEWEQQGTVHWGKFLLRRGRKIWPSYYWFLIAGTLLVGLLNPQEQIASVITPPEYPRYLFFYKNYTGAPFHHAFDHVWSLCVEEHFYFFFPLVFLVLSIWKRNRQALLAAAILAIIIAGPVFRYLVQLYTQSRNTYGSTHNHVDALGWGVMLAYLLTYRRTWFENKARMQIALLAGLCLFVVNTWLYFHTTSEGYKKIVFQSVTPLAFALLIGSLYLRNIRGWKPVRLIAYYSYNLYLWHPPVALFVSYWLGVSAWGLLVYVSITFLLGVCFTVLIEEPFLRRQRASPAQPDKL